MRVFILLAMFLITACSSGPDTNQQAVNQVKGFYSFYLNAFVSDSLPALQSPEMLHYVAADTLTQLEKINQLPEPDFFNADYFTYGQDYDPAWIPALKVGPARDLMGGKVVNVWLGIDAGKHKHLEAYVRQEASVWKIYRVRDISSNYESPIFDNAAIERARTGSQD